MRTILAATDFSAGADHAIERARRLAARYGARLVVAHVGGTGEVELRAKLPPTLRATLDCRDGAVGECIAAAARAHDADLVVIGRPARVAFRGSTAERALLASERPVIVVKRAPERDYARVVLATDVSEVSRVALKTTLRLLPDCAVTLVHVFETPFQAFLDPAQTRGPIEEQRRAEVDEIVRDALMGLPDGSPREIDVVMREGLAFRELALESARRDADVVVFGTRARTGLGRLVLGSVAAELIDGIDRDVMVVPPGA